MSASAYPDSTLALWEARPTAPAVLPCGRAFDVVNVPAFFGRRLLDRLWDEGPGSGPVAAHRGRVLLLAAAPPAGCRRCWTGRSGAAPSRRCCATARATP